MKALRVSADPVAKLAAHTRAESRGSRPTKADAGERLTLSAGGSRIRTIGPVEAHIGARSGVEITQTATQPPGRRTRRNSVNPASGWGKNCKPKLADDGIKAAVGKWQGLLIGRNEPKQGLSQSIARAFEHRRRDVYADHPAWCADQGNHRLSGFAGAGGNIEHAVVGRHLGGSNNGRDEPARPPANVTVICRAIDRPGRLACGHPGPRYRGHGGPQDAIALLMLSLPDYRRFQA